MSFVKIECTKNPGGRGSYRFKPFSISFEDDPELGYLFGYLLGDGWVGSTTGQIGWLTKDDPSHILPLILHYFSSFKLSESKSKGVFTFRISSVYLRDSLLSVGFKQGARQKEIPLFLVDSPDSVRKAVLQGLFDSDGCASLHEIKSRQYRQLEVSFRSTSEKLSRQVQDLLQSLGVKSHLVPHESGSPQWNEGWDVRLYSKEDVFAFYSKVSFRLERKQTVLQENLSLLVPLRRGGGCLSQYEQLSLLPK